MRNIWQGTNWHSAGGIRRGRGELRLGLLFTELLRVFQQLAGLFKLLIYYLYLKVSFTAYREHSAEFKLV